MIKSLKNKIAFISLAVMFSFLLTGSAINEAKAQASGSYGYEELSTDLDEVYKRAQDTAKTHGESISNTWGAGTVFYDDNAGAVNRYLKSSSSDCADPALVYDKHMSDCWQCTLLETLFNAINNLSTKTYNRINSGIFALLGTFLGLWLLFQVGRFIGSMKQQKESEELDKVFGVFFKAMIASALLALSASNLAGFIISPFTVTAAELNISILESFTQTDNLVKDEDAQKHLETIREKETDLAEVKKAIAWLDTTVNSAESSGNFLNWYSSYLNKYGLSPEVFYRTNDGAGYSPKIELPKAAKPESNSAWEVVGTCLDNPDGKIMIIDDITYAVSTKTLRDACKEKFFNTMEAKRKYAQDLATALEKQIAKEKLLLNGLDLTAGYCEAMKAEPTEEQKASFDGRVVSSRFDSLNSYDDSMLNSQIYNSLMCMTSSIHKTTAFGSAMGSWFMCRSWTHNSFMGFKFPSLRLLFMGCVIWLVSFLLSLIFVFKLIDAVFRLGFLMVLLPLLIVAWVFPPTVEFAKKGLTMLIHIILIFIVMGIVLALSLLLVEVSFFKQTTMQDMYNITYEETASAADDSDVYSPASTTVSMADAMPTHTQYTNDFNNSGNELRKAFEEGEITDEIMNQTDFSFLNFIIIIICLLFAIKITSLIDTLAMEFSNTSFGTDMGDKLSMMGASVISNTAQGLATIGAVSAASGRSRRGSSGSSYSSYDGGGYDSGSHSSASHRTYTPSGSAGGGSSGDTRSYESYSADSSGVSSSAGSYAYTPNPASTDKYTVDFMGYEQSDFRQLNVDIRTAREAFSNPAARASLEHNARAKAFYESGEDEVRAMEQAYGNASVIRDVYGESNLASMSEGDRKNLIDIKPEDSSTLATKSKEDFAQYKANVELAERVRHGTASSMEASEANKQAYRDDEMKNLLMMSEENFQKQQEYIKAEGYKRTV